MTNAFVARKWRTYRIHWCFNVTIPSLALVLLTFAPVSNKEWPFVLAALWVFYLLCLTSEVLEYLEMRVVYLKLRFEETPKWVKNTRTN